MITHNKVLIIAFFTIGIGFSQGNKVRIDLTTQKYVGKESELNREKYFNIHSTYTTSELSHESDYLFNQLGIEFGRAFSGPAPFYRSTTEVPGSDEAEKRAKNIYKNSQNTPLYKKYKTHDIVITDHPRTAFQLHMDPKKIAAYNVAYLKNAFPVLPRYYEVMNEPFVHAKDYVKTWAETGAVIEEMSKLYKEVADKVHEEIPEMMVGGYASAWPEMDRKDFEHWNTRMKLFMDTAGESMKFFATHLYDGRNVRGDSNYRSGSNGEAILDLIESYSYKKWGIVKPHLISEYGYTAKGVLGTPYSAELSGLILVSCNNILMSLLDKPDRLLKSIPFITAEAGWFYKNKEKNPEGHPYPFVIMRKTKDGTKKFTDLKKFYELWKGVEGKRIDIISNNPDIQANAFIKKGKAYIALNNLDVTEQSTHLEFLNKSKEHIQNVTLRRLYLDVSKKPKLIYFTNHGIPEKIALKGNETVILECDLDAIIPDKVIRENNYYSKTYLQKIEADKTIPFIIEKVGNGNNGRATIRMGLARGHHLSKKPAITFNGHKVVVPDNWAGYDQANREQFFGVINIPVDIVHTISDKNTIEVIFPDTGGYISSMILNVEKLE